MMYDDTNESHLSMLDGHRAAQARYTAKRNAEREQAELEAAEDAKATDLHNAEHGDNWV